MSNRIRMFAILAVAISVGAAVSAMQAPQASAQDEAALRQVVQKVEDGWNAHDGAAFAAPFALDADYVVVNGTHVKGKAAIEKGHTAIFSTIYQDSHNEGTVKSIRFLRPDVAVVHVEWELQFQADGVLRKGHAMNTMVMTRAGEECSIAVFHNTPIQAESR